MTEEMQVIQSCLEGNHDEFESLVNRYHRSLMSVAYRYLNNWEDSKDAAQEAFIRAYRSLDSFQLGRSFSAWIHRILINICLDKRKSAYSRQRITLDETAHHPEEQDVLSSIDNSDLMRWLLGQLSKRRRDAFILTDLQGFTNKETAEILGCSEPTVRVHRMKARECLRKKVRRMMET